MSSRSDAWRYQQHKPRMMRQFGGRCWYCRRHLQARAATIDHVTPYRDGGMPDQENLRLACGPCNQLRDALMGPGLPDPAAGELMRAYARAMLLLSARPQGRARLAAAGMDRRALAPALDWLEACGLAARPGRERRWQATAAGLLLGRAVRSGLRDVPWLRGLLADPARVRRAVAAARRGASPAGIVRAADASVSARRRAAVP